jgi:hypothetical protein
VFQSRSPLESPAAFAIAFVAGIVSTILVKRRVDTAVKMAIKKQDSG